MVPFVPGGPDVRRATGPGLTVPTRGWSRPGPDGPGKSRLAREWATALVPAAPAGRLRAEIELHLRRHLETMHDALLAEPVDRAAAAAVGAALVELGMTRPEAVAATVALLADRLLADLGLDEVTFGAGLHALLGALAGGYAGALSTRPGGGPTGNPGAESGPGWHR
jgi:hypothetical protein